ncbi:NUDIX hydrolase [Alloalcanivorax sp. C16-2]|uniref:NUDIX hydrolase n=1 Tax=Alloalcanivorax TaxID=3020832 RepID=UPI0019347F92|nr:NUDIX hydrolase [Alloalcanivorax marinus]MBL7249966.1 NUDIX hydrolase [Alloalcanivorax marinus]UWN52196.1 Phosphatase NudJ [Alcanivorax sp. ALC70]
MNSFEPHITVATIVEQEGRLLFVREMQAGQAVLNQPAGHAEFGEDLMQAAYRETLEETAWRVEITDLLGWYIFQPRPGAGVYYRTCFVARALGHDPHQKLDTGILEALWLSPEELQARRDEHRGPLVERCVADYLSGRRLPLDAIYQHPWPLQRG